MQQNKCIIKTVVALSLFLVCSCSNSLRKEAMDAKMYETDPFRQGVLLGMFHTTDIMLEASKGKTDIKTGEDLLAEVMKRSLRSIKMGKLK